VHLVNQVAPRRCRQILAAVAREDYSGVARVVFNGQTHGAEPQRFHARGESWAPSVERDLDAVRAAEDRTLTAVTVRRTLDAGRSTGRSEFGETSSAQRASREATRVANERTWLGGKRESGIGCERLQSLRRMHALRSCSMIVHVYVVSCEPPRRCSGYESQARGGGGVTLSESGCAAVV